MSWKGAIYRAFLKIYRALPFKRSIAYFIRFLKLPVDRFYIDLRFYGKFRARLGHRSIRLIHYYQTTIENEIFWKGLENGWEKETQKLWLRFCKSARVIFDVGANTGIYSLISAATNPASGIYAFEPSARVYEKLVRNCTLNKFPNIRCIEKAFSDHNGTAVFYDVDTPHQYSASLNPSMLGRSESTRELLIEVMTLDGFIENNRIPQLDLIKIDVEMHEPEVFQGFIHSLVKFRPVIFIEILTDEIGSKIENLMSDHDYLYCSIDETSGAVLKENIRRGKNFNYILCPREKSAPLFQEK